MRAIVICSVCAIAAVVFISGCAKKSEQVTLWHNIKVNNKQAECLGKYIKDLATPDRSGSYLDVHEHDIRRIESDILESLFKDYVFISLPYELKYTHDAEHYSRTIGIHHYTIAVNETCNKQYVFWEYGNYEEFGDFLRDEGITVNSIEDAKIIWEAFRDIHNKGSEGDFVKMDNNKWKLARHLNDFRSISDSEEIREEYYYLLELAEDKTVIKGMLHCDIVERRNIMHKPEDLNKE
jgi:hypothetical protein